jgi:uncharacterized membrane protein YfcA
MDGKEKEIKLWQKALIGSIGGIINGFFGSGGGVAIVLLLEHFGVPKKKAHSMSVGIILPLSVISAVGYLFSGTLPFSDSLKYIPLGLVGSFLGVWLLKVIPIIYLRILFCGLLIFSGLWVLVR